jgi:hypothetical protein
VEDLPSAQDHPNKLLFSPINNAVIASAAHYVLARATIENLVASGIRRTRPFARAEPRKSRGCRSGRRGRSTPGTVEAIEPGSEECHPCKRPGGSTPATGFAHQEPAEVPSNTAANPVSPFGLLALPEPRTRGHPLRSVDRSALKAWPIPPERLEITWPPLLVEVKSFTFVDLSDFAMSFPLLCGSRIRVEPLFAHLQPLTQPRCRRNPSTLRFFSCILLVKCIGDSLYFQRSALKAYVLTHSKAL